MPERDTHAFIDLLAGEDGGGVICSLLRQILTRIGRVDTYVELGDSDFDTECSESLHIRHLLGGAWG